MKLSFGKKIAGLAVAGVVMAGAGTMAWADSNGSPAATPTTKAPAAAAKATDKAAGKGLAILRRADHGDVEVKVKDGGSGTPAWKTVSFDKGQVTDVAADHITLARPDGKSVRLTINASTKYKGITSWQEVAKSKGAIVISENGTATTILQRKAPASATGGAPAA